MLYIDNVNVILFLFLDWETMKMKTTSYEFKEELQKGGNCDCLNGEGNTASISGFYRRAKGIYHKLETVFERAPNEEKGYNMVLGGPLMGLGVVSGNVPLTIMGAAMFVSGYLNKDDKMKGFNAFF